MEQFFYYTGAVSIISVIVIGILFIWYIATEVFVMKLFKQSKQCYYLVLACIWLKFRKKPNRFQKEWLHKSCISHEELNEFMDWRRKMKRSSNYGQR